MSILEVERDPYADSTLVLGDKGVSIRTNNGTQNNLNKPSLGGANTPFITLAPIRFEDGIQSPSGVAFDAEGNPLIRIDGHPVTRQPVPIFSAAEKDGLTEIGLKVVENTNGFGFTTANQDGVSHVQKLGSGNTFTFALEDMTGSVTNGSDRDFNDVVMKVTLV